MIEITDIMIEITQIVKKYLWQFFLLRLSECYLDKCVTLYWSHNGVVETSTNATSLHAILC